ncbi:MAG TPA: quinone-dependent dihydroorotate dehydrogenase [Gammaproteobacteria bacterium]|nr:quinone-dependent dihydroorotate dehydrogenase [Gammaproteobacteria bacterium]
MYPLLRFVLFRLDPETAHHLALSGLKLLARTGILRLCCGRRIVAPCRVMGLDFPNPVGLAAGLDKNGDYIDALGALGFGFIEVGTVTPRPQAGNPRPRLFRLPGAHALINRMGFNNKGVNHLVEQVRRSRFDGVLGINIGKNRDTPVARAAQDYLYCLRKVYPFAGYVAVNVSSPNTPGLRQLQGRAALEALLRALKAAQRELAEQHGRYVPLVLKIAPDLAPGAIADLAAVVVAHEVDGVIATNTTVSREGVQGLAQAAEQGGLSGAPLKHSADDVLRVLAGALAGRAAIIAAGGIMCGADGRDKVKAGADLVQIYTGLIYRGPALVNEVVRAVQETV